MSSLYGGRWNIVETLGGGGQGDVFRVKDSSGALDGTFALKRLRDVNRVARFRTEIMALKRLSNDNIVRILDHSPLDETEERHFLVMPLAVGGDAEKRLALFKGNIGNVVEVALQIARTLQAAHGAGVIHRDVKPGNVLFPTEGLDVWLADFGICRLEGTSGDTPEGAVMGPRRFAAPEIEQGNAADVSGSVDIYSLGQLVFYLLSGGATFYRELVMSDEYNRHFPDGQRSSQLRNLLGNMVTAESNRADINSVINSLKRILDWESQASIPLLDAANLARIAQLQSAVQLDERKKIDEKLAEEQRIALLDAATAAIRTRLVANLGPVMAAVNEGPLLVAYRAAQSRDLELTFSRPPLRQLAGAGIGIRRAADAKMAREIHFVIAQAMNVRAGRVYVLPILVATPSNAAPRYGVLTNKGTVPLQISNQHLSAINGKIFEQVTPAMLMIDAATWPDALVQLDEFANTQVGAFFDWVNKGESKGG